MLNTNRIVWILGAATVLAAFVQLAIGADVLILLLALVSIACGLYAFWLFGASNLAAWVALCYMAGNVLIAFLAKTFIFLQPLDSNLLTPFNSFMAQAISGVAMLCALIVVTWVNVGKPVMAPMTDLTTLRLVSLWCMVLGFGVNLINIFIARGGDSSFGGLNVFGSLLYLGIIGHTSLLMLRSGGRRMIDATLLVVLCVTMLSGILSTGKSELAYPFVCFFMTIIFFKGKLPRRYLAALVAGLIFFLAVTPIMLTFRYMGLRSLPLAREIEVFEYMLPTLLNIDELSLLAAKHAHMKSVYYDYYGNHEGQLILGRFSSIQQNDPIINAIDMRGTVGGQIFIDGIRMRLPKFLDADKPTETPGFALIKAIGISNGQGGSRPTVPMVAMVYAAYGMEGLVWIPFLLFLVYFLALKKIGWYIPGNVFSIFLLSVCVLVINGMGFDGYVGFVFRDMPLVCGSVLIMQWVAGLLTLHRREFGSS